MRSSSRLLTHRRHPRQIKEVLSPHGSVGNVTFESYEGRMAAVVRLSPAEGSSLETLLEALRVAFPVDPAAQQTRRPGGLPPPLASVPLGKGRLSSLDVLGALNCGPNMNPLLFVSNVPESMDDARLAEAFGASGGAVSRAWTMHDPQGAPKRYGFVEFVLPSAAGAVVANPSSCQVDGCVIKVEPACTRRASQMFARTLFVDQFPRESTTAASLRALAEPHGVVTDVSLPLFPGTHPQAGQPRGYAFLEFARSDAAHAARTALDGLEVQPAMRLRANFSNPTKHMAPPRPAKNAQQQAADKAQMQMRAKQGGAHLPPARGAPGMPQPQGPWGAGGGGGVRGGPPGGYPPHPGHTFMGARGGMVPGPGPGGMMQLGPAHMMGAMGAPPPHMMGYGPPPGAMGMVGPAAMFAAQQAQMAGLRMAQQQQQQAMAAAVHQQQFAAQQAQYMAAAAQWGGGAGRGMGVPPAAGPPGGGYGAPGGPPQGDPWGAYSAPDRGQGAGRGRGSATLQGAGGGPQPGGGGAPGGPPNPYADYYAQYGGAAQQPQGAAQQTQPTPGGPEHTAAWMAYYAAQAQAGQGHAHPAAAAAAAAQQQSYTYAYADDGSGGGAKRQRMG